MSRHVDESVDPADDPRRPWDAPRYNRIPRHRADPPRREQTTAAAGPCAPGEHTYLTFETGLGCARCPTFVLTRKERSLWIEKFPARLVPVQYPEPV